MIDLDACDVDDQLALKQLLEQHLAYTNSSVAKFILSDFESELKRFVKVFPKDYKRALAAKRTNAELSK
ncbi:MAG: hypothetical protein EAY75_04650 [Bacteroidetes bacterium]|nr:MAG: hypothetical protein EAY75_04650 [Bacteroidota bacterium]